MRRGIGQITALAILCVALGAGSARAAGWSIESMPKPLGAVSVFPVAVSCPNQLTCTSVGYYYDGDIVSRLLVEQWNAGRWRGQSIPSPTDVTGDELRAIACTTPRACTAVGDYTSTSGSTAPLAERWNGKQWSIEPTATGDAGFGELAGVSCTSSRSCTAVGDRLNLTQFPPTAATLVEHWDGNTWSVKTTPVVDSGASQLFGVSCPRADECFAVGSRFSSSRGGIDAGSAWERLELVDRLHAQPGRNPDGGLRASLGLVPERHVLHSRGTGADDRASCLGLGAHRELERLRLVARAQADRRRAVQRTPRRVMRERFSLHSGRVQRLLRHRDARQPVEWQRLEPRAFAQPGRRQPPQRCLLPRCRRVHDGRLLLRRDDR